MSDRSDCCHGLGECFDWCERGRVRSALNREVMRAQAIKERDPASPVLPVFKVLITSHRAALDRLEAQQ